MARFLLLLSFLLLNLTKVSNAQYQACYCIFPNNDGRCYANTQCWACAPGAYDPSWQSNFCLGYQAPAPVPVTCTSTFVEKTESCQANYSGAKKYKQETKTCTDGQVTVYPWQLYADTCVQNPVTCTYSAQTETRSCPANYSGTQVWKKETNCPSGSYGQPVQTDWFKIQDTCIQNPPTCQVSVQQQTLSCQTGYTGSITQTRSSTCPDPYGSPVLQPWVTTSDTCKKSASNPTNPVSPVNPASPTATPPAPTPQPAPVQTPSPNPVPSSIATPTEAAPTETKPVQSQEKSATTESVQPSVSVTTPTIQTPKGKAQSVVGLVLSLELFQKPSIQQPNVFPEVSIVQGIPNAILMQDVIVMDLIKQNGFNQPSYNQDLGFEQ